MESDRMQIIKQCLTHQLFQHMLLNFAFKEIYIYYAEFTSIEVAAFADRYL